MRRLTLRLRLTVVITLVCLAGVALIGAALYQSSERMELALLEQLVGEELEFLVQHHAANPLYEPGAGPYIQRYIIQSDDDQNLPDYLYTLSQGQHEVLLAGASSEHDVLIRDVGEVRYAVVYQMGPYEEREQEFQRLVLILLGVVVCFAPLLGYWLAGLLTRQLTLLANRVATLSPDAPYAPLEHDGQDNEVAMLAGAFDQYHTLFFDMMKREKEFTANVSHELRTPLTAIRTSCELLAKDEGLSGKSLERVRQIRHAVDGMTERVVSLLFLARGRRFNEQEAILLQECVQSVLESFSDEINEKSLSCDVVIAPATLLMVNHQALSLVLANLIGNAVRYTERGGIRITYTPGRIVISDTGIGIPAEQLAHIFERSYRGEKSASGFGLGLDISRRVCVDCGWKIDVNSVVGEGSTFILSLG